MPCHWYNIHMGIHPRDIFLSQSTYTLIPPVTSGCLTATGLGEKSSEFWKLPRRKTLARPVC